MGEMPILLTEKEITGLLGQLQQFYAEGFRPPLPQMARTPNQASDLFVMLAQVDIGPTITIGLSAFMKKTGMGSLYSRGIKVSEDTGKVMGKTDIVLCGDPGKGAYTLNVRSGKDRSLDIISLCRTLNINYLTVTERVGIDRITTEQAIRTIAAWANRLILSNAQQVR